MGAAASYCRTPVIYTGQHCVTTERTVIFTVTTVRTWSFSLLVATYPAAGVTAEQLAHCFQCVCRATLETKQWRLQKGRKVTLPADRHAEFLLLLLPLIWTSYDSEWIPWAGNLLGRICVVVSNNPQTLSPTATARLSTAFQLLHYSSCITASALQLLHSAEIAWDFFYTYLFSRMAPYFKILGTASGNNILFSYDRGYESFGLTCSNAVEICRVTKVSEKHITSICLCPEYGSTTFLRIACNHLPA